MTGILALWNDCAPEAAAEYERWYAREHLPERVGLPGFRFGRRYEALRADRQFFTFYEVDGPEVLLSPAYLERLRNPTPWTRAIMPSFRGMSRTVCDLAASAGAGLGAHAVTLRVEGGMAPRPDAAAAITALAEQEGVARVQLWRRAARQTPSDTPEMTSRDRPDTLIAGALVIECLRRADAERQAAALEAQGPPAALGVTGPVSLGVYALLCIRTAERP